jgi:hypothetical protein
MNMHVYINPNNALFEFGVKLILNNVLNIYDNGIIIRSTKTTK